MTCNFGVYKKKIDLTPSKSNSLYLLTKKEHPDILFQRELHPNKDKKNLKRGNVNQGYNLCSAQTIYLHLKQTVPYGLRQG